jgi:hypothetical protein
MNSLRDARSGVARMMLETKLRPSTTKPFGLPIPVCSSFRYLCYRVGGTRVGSRASCEVKVLLSRESEVESFAERVNLIQRDFVIAIAVDCFKDASSNVYAPLKIPCIDGFRRRFDECSVA